jgi:hypothetical protein
MSEVQLTCFLTNVALVGIAGEGDAGLHPVAVAALLGGVVCGREVQEAVGAKGARTKKGVHIRA